MDKSEIDIILVFVKLNEEKFGEQLKLFLSNLESMGFTLEIVSSQCLKNRKFVKVQIPPEELVYAAGMYRIGLACQNPFHEPEPETPPCLLLLDSELTTREPSLSVSVRNRESVKGEKPQDPTSAERIMIAYEALRVVNFGDQPNEIGIEEMKKEGILAAAYPLHDGQWEWTKTGPLNDRQLLNAYWSKIMAFCKIQPIQLIHKYFGPEVGFYYAMIGLYMTMLAPASMFGLLSFWAYNVKNDPRLLRICKTKFCMCPYCISPKVCSFSWLGSSCKYSRLNFMFDNDFAMPYSIAMAFWGMIFMSIWERKQSFLRVAWNIHRFLRPDFITRPGYYRKLKKHSQTRTRQGKSPQRKNVWGRFKSRMVNVYGNITKRFFTKKSTVNQSRSTTKKTQPRPEKPKPVEDAEPSSSSCGSIFSRSGKSNQFNEEINEDDIPYSTLKQQLAPLKYLLIGIIIVICVEFLILIGFILSRIFLTQKIDASAKKPPAEKKIKINFRGNAITYTAIITAGFGAAIIILFDYGIDYLALFLTNRENPKTQSEFDRSYTIKLVALSFINNFTIPIYLGLFRGINFTYPGDKKMWQFFWGINTDVCDISGCFADLWIFIATITVMKSLFNICRNALYPIFYKDLMGTERLFEITKHPQWELDYDLTPLPRYYFTKLNKEFIIQYGYVVFFSSSFTLLPLIVLTLNIIELRVHAMMLVRFFQRFVPRQSCERDIWKKILYIVTTFAVFINALILGTTLNWAERHYYKKYVDKNLEGYVDASLSKFTIEDYGKFMAETTLKECYYVGRREPKDSEHDHRKYQFSDFYYETYCMKYLFSAVLLVSPIIFGIIFRFVTSPPLYLQEKIIYQEKTHPN